MTTAALDPTRRTTTPHRPTTQGASLVRTLRDTWLIYRWVDHKVSGFRTIGFQRRS